MTATATKRPATGDAAAAGWALVQRAQAGDADAFGAIYARYRPAVFRFVFYRTGGEQQLAEDLTSETFLKALRRIGSVSWQGSDIGAWLVTIARHLVFDHFKAAATRLVFTVDGAALSWVPEWQPGRSDTPPDPVDEAVAADQARLLHAALRELNEHQRTVIELRFYDGLSVEETAQKMGITVGACKALQFRAVRSLGRLPQVQALRPGAVLPV